MDWQDPFRQWFNASYSPAQPDEQQAPVGNAGFFGSLFGGLEHGAESLVHGGAKVGSFFGNMVKETVKGAADVGEYFLKTDIINPARELAAQATGNKEAYRNVEKDIKKTMGNNAGEALKRLAGNSAQLASLFLGPEAQAGRLANVGRVAGGGALASGGASAANNESAADIAKSAAVGALFGGALQGGAQLATKGGRAALADLPQNLKDRFIQPVYAHYDPNASPLEHAADNAELARRQLNGEPLPTREPNLDDQAIHSYASEFKNPDQLITQIAKDALEREKSQGVDLVPNGEQYGYGVKRQSTHATWYSNLYGERGGKPSLAATKDAVESALRSGGDGGGLIFPGEREAYQLVADREAGLQHTIAEGPPADLSTDYMDKLAGKSQAVETPNPQRTLKLGRAQGKFQEPVLPPGTPNASTEVFPANQRGFFRNVRTSDTASPELKSAVAEVNPQTYSDISTNRELVQNAVRQADENPQAIHDKILSGNDLNDQDVVSGLHLMGRYQAEGKIDDAVRLADSLDTNLRAHGRAVQAASVWNRLSPEGVLRTASNRYSKAREQISAGRGYGKGVGAEKGVARDIKKTVEGAAKLTKEKIAETVRRTADDILDKKPPTTGERIATNVEKMATPAVKKKADELVKEITKKVKQEMLRQAGKKTPRSPIEVMREVFSRNAEAQQAFPEAQRILMDKAKDSPQLQETLKQFFESELGQPVAGSTYNAAIKEQLKNSATRISDIIDRSWNGQAESIDTIAKEIVKEGFTPADARDIAKEITDRLKAQTVVAKRSALNRLAKDVPKRQRASFLDKVNKLSNLGGLDDHDYLELARTRLKLPQLTEETATKISKLSQQLQDMEPGYERDKLAHQIYRTINESIPKTLGQKAAEVISAPKSIMASYDLSATLRQGGVLGSRFRKEAGDAFKKSVKYMSSSEAYEKGMSAIRHDPMYETAARAKIALTGVEGGEEAFVSQLPERIPVLGKGVQASDRAYTGALTELRFNSFKHIAQDLADAGIDINTFSDEQLQSIGKFINTASGRGYGAPGGLFEKMAPALNRTLFSPRLWKSRLDMLNPVYYAKLDPVARKYALQSAGNFAAIAASVLGLASLMGAKVETDPRSSDFLKIRFGDTRYDILGGFQQNLVFAARELSGQKKSSTTGEIQSLTSGDFGSANRLSILSDLIQNKENPVISAGADILRGTDATGKPVNPLTTLGSLVVPLNIQDTYAKAKTDPISALFTAGLPGTIGVGVNTYASPDNQFGQFNAALMGR